jgi:hypothetical protein
MKTIPYSLFNGTTEQLITRVEAFRAARIAHASTVGAPAPREEDFVEFLCDLQEPYGVEPKPVVMPPSLPPTQAELDAQAAEVVRRETFESTIRGDSIVTQLKGMTAAEFDAWWDINVTNAAQAIAILKRLTRLIIVRLL